MFKQYNANPSGKNTIDCTIRAISKVTGMPWRKVYAEVCAQGYEDYDMPSSNAVWSKFLRKHGFTRYMIPNTCPDCYTVKDFCKDHPAGAYVLATGTHAIAIDSGSYFDTWDSGDELPLFYWTKEN